MAECWAEDTVESVSYLCSLQADIWVLVKEGLAHELLVHNSPVPDVLLDSKLVNNEVEHF